MVKDVLDDTENTQDSGWDITKQLSSFGKKKKNIWQVYEIRLPFTVYGAARDFAL